MRRQAGPLGAKRPEPSITGSVLPILRYRLDLLIHLIQQEVPMPPFVESAVSKSHGMHRRSSLNDGLVYGALAVICLIVRMQTLADPVLGFDEQFYLLMADRMLQGAIPYVDLWDRKPVGIFLIYALAIPLGGDPFLQYKLLAAVFVATTAFLIYKVARPRTSGFGAMSAALLYVVWLNLMEGEGGQSPVFYNLPMLLAAIMTMRAVETRQHIFARGSLAMILAGIAIQIKYTVIFEGMFFGVALLWATVKSGGGLKMLGASAIAWVALALAPTALAFGFYVWIGQADAFIFANFLSVFGKQANPALDQLGGLMLILLLIAPIATLVVLDWRRRRMIGFLHLWLASALAGMLAFGSFLAPGYALPILLPLCLCAAYYFSGAPRGRIVSIALIGFALVAGQIVIHQTIRSKGGRAEAQAVAAAARPRQGCLWVYDGYPALYMLTQSCVPTKWAFPGHLNTADENSPEAIGIDPVVEVGRILATRPDVIVDDYPAYRLGNAATRRLVEAALARDYHLAARIQTGQARYRLVYRLNDIMTEAVNPASR